MTAYTMKEDREKSMEAGMDGYLSKPLNTQDLYNEIEKFLKLKEAPVDLSGIMEVAGDNPEFVKEIVRMLLNRYPSQIQEMVVSIEENDSVKLEKRTHTLGAISHFRAATAYDLVSQLEMLGGNRELNGANKVLTALKREMLRIEKYLKSGQKMKM